MIYADFNATTPIGNASKEQMEKAFSAWGNASSSHRLGRQANELLEQSRISVAQAVGAKPSEVIFTSGGSEANTMAVLGSYFQNKSGFRLLTSGVEHSSLLGTTTLLKEMGTEVQLVPVSKSGELDIASFSKLLADFKPSLVSLMTANNETGVLFPIPELVRLTHAAGALFHTDAVQAFGKLPNDYWQEADFISISGHKIFAPKGVGALIVRQGRQLVATHYGGSQEVKRRGGTENVLGIAGFGGAANDLPATGTLEQIRELRDKFEKTLLQNLSGVTVQGGNMPRIPNTSNLRFQDIPSEVLLSLLDLEGVYVSAGSACSSGSISPSHVLLEMGLSKTEAKECVRFSWGKTTSSQDIDSVAEIVISQVNRIRTRRKS